LSTVSRLASGSLEAPLFINFRHCGNITGSTIGIGKGNVTRKLAFPQLRRKPLPTPDWALRSNPPARAFGLCCEASFSDQSDHNVVPYVFIKNYQIALF
jgi:hypothetical protein